MLMPKRKYKPARIPINAIPPKRHNATDAPCLTATISFDQSRLGNLRLRKSPNVPVNIINKNGRIADIIQITGSAPIIRQASRAINTVGTYATITWSLSFCIRIVKGSTGSDWRSHIVFPSIEILGAVISQVDARVQSAPQTIKGRYCVNSPGISAIIA